MSGRCEAKIRGTFRLFLPAPPPPVQTTHSDMHSKRGDGRAVHKNVARRTIRHRMTPTGRQPVTA